jgi:hypothetical protein
VTDLDDVQLEQAAELLNAAAELLTTAPPPISELDPDEATRILARIRDAGDTVGKIDALLCAHLVGQRWGELEVDGLGVVKYRRTEKRERWDERGAAYAVLETKMAERGGELPDPRDVVDWLLEAASVGYFRKTALRSMGIDPGDYHHSERGNPAVDLPKRRRL